MGRPLRQTTQRDLPNGRLDPDDLRLDSETPRGYVRDLGVRGALEEAGLAHRVESTSFRDRGPSISRTSLSAM
jgi:hypothetical protein